MQIIYYCKGKSIRLLFKSNVYGLISMVMIEEELTEAGDQGNDLCYAGLVFSFSPPSHGSSSHKIDIQ